MGHKYAPEAPTMPQVQRNEPTPTPAPYTPETSVAPQISPPTVPATPNTGNGMIWCSGPQAPGWNVNLPDGGCSRASSTSTVIHLDQLPYTGDSVSEVNINIGLFGAITLVAALGAIALAKRIRGV